eukprot:scaffold1516_cov230-Pinguiococcus_pyrenoidosus.AAC.16
MSASVGASWLGRTGPPRQNQRHASLRSGAVAAAAGARPLWAEHARREEDNPPPLTFHRFCQRRGRLMRQSSVAHAVAQHGVDPPQLLHVSLQLLDALVHLLLPARLSADALHQRAIQRAVRKHRPTVSSFQTSALVQRHLRQPPRALVPREGGLGRVAHTGEQHARQQQHQQPDEIGGGAAAVVGRLWRCGVHTTRPV